MLNMRCYVSSSKAYVNLFMFAGRYVAGSSVSDIYKWAAYKGYYWTHWGNALIAYSQLPELKLLEQKKSETSEEDGTKSHN
jgi:hypothetical protein